MIPCSAQETPTNECFTCAVHSIIHTCAHTHINHRRFFAGRIEIEEDTNYSALLINFSKLNLNSQVSLILESFVNWLKLLLRTFDFLSSLWFSFSTIVISVSKHIISELFVPDLAPVNIHQQAGHGGKFSPSSSGRFVIDTHQQIKKSLFFPVCCPSRTNTGTEKRKKRSGVATWISIYLTASNKLQDSVELVPVRTLSFRCSEDKWQHVPREGDSGNRRELEGGNVKARTHLAPSEDYRWPWLTLTGSELFLEPWTWPSDVWSPDNGPGCQKCLVIEEFHSPDGAHS